MLVIAPAGVDGRELRDQVERRVEQGPVQVHVVSPAVRHARIRWAMGEEVDEASLHARDHLREAIGDLAEGRIRASGRIGDADPIIAAQDALAIFPADEILIVSDAEGQAEWFESTLLYRAAERLEPPISHGVVPSGG